MASHVLDASIACSEDFPGLLCGRLVTRCGGVRDRLVVLGIGQWLLVHPLMQCAGDNGESASNALAIEDFLRETKQRHFGEFALAAPARLCSCGSLWTTGARAVRCTCLPIAMQSSDRDENNRSHGSAGAGACMLTFKRAQLHNIAASCIRRLFACRETVKKMRHRCFNQGAAL